MKLVERINQTDYTIYLPPHTTAWPSNFFPFLVVPKSNKSSNTVNLGMNTCFRTSLDAWLRIANPPTPVAVINTHLLMGLSMNVVVLGFKMTNSGGTAWCSGSQEAKKPGLPFPTPKHSHYLAKALSFRLGVI